MRRHKFKPNLRRQVRSHKQEAKMGKGKKPPKC